MRFHDFRRQEESKKCNWTEYALQFDRKSIEYKSRIGERNYRMFVCVCVSVCEYRRPIIMPIIAITYFCCRVSLFSSASNMPLVCLVVQS